MGGGFCCWCGRGIGLVGKGLRLLGRLVGLVGGLVGIERGALGGGRLAFLLAWIGGWLGFV